MKQDLFEMCKEDIQHVKIEGIYTLIRVNEEVLKYSHIEYNRKAAREEIAQLEELLRLRREYDQSNDN